MANKSDIDIAIAMAEAETGVRGRKSSIPLCFVPAMEHRTRLWTEEEEQYLRDNHGRKSKEEIAKHLGRSLISVNLHIKRELHLVSMSKDPDILTAEQVANGIGLDSKSIHLLMDRGLMPGRRLPSERVMRVINKMALMKWILDPDNWLYFKPQRVGELARGGKRGYGESYDFAFWEEAKILIRKALINWKDEWLTPGDVVRVLNINPKPRPNFPRKDTDKVPGVRYVNLAIRKGNLKATRWGNWRIKKSDLPGEGKTINFRGEIITIKKGKSHGHNNYS